MKRESVSSTDIGHLPYQYIIVGEYQIARAFSRALVSGLQIGSTPLEVPATIPPRPLPKPENFEIYSSTIGVTAIWDKGMFVIGRAPIGDVCE